MAYTPDQIARVRKGLKDANSPIWETASDDQAVAEFLKTAVPDAFTQELQTSTPGTPGLPATSGNQAKPPEAIADEMFKWASGFKGLAGHAPTRAEWTEAWGDVGGQTYDWGVGMRNQNVDVTQNLDFWKSSVGGLVQRADLQGGLGGTIGSTYAQGETLGQQKFAWDKDFQTAKQVSDKAYQDAQIALQQGNQALAQQQFDYAKQQGDQANAIQLAGLTGTYNGQPTMAMQQFTQNQANFQQQFGLAYDQFQFQKDQFAKTYGLQEAQITGMFAGNPTLAMQQFQANKDQFAQNLKLNEGQLTGTYNGAPTEAARQFNVSQSGRLNGDLTLAGQQVAYNAARAGNPLQYLQTIQGGGPVNYAGMSQPGGVPGLRNTQPVGQPVIAGAPGLPQAPQNIQNIMAGAPLPAANVTAPGVRLAGAQAQANETPLQQSARMESYELAGARQEDIMNAEAKIKRNLGQGLKSASYVPGR